MAADTELLPRLCYTIDVMLLAPPCPSSSIDALPPEDGPPPADILPPTLLKHAAMQLVLLRPDEALPAPPLDRAHAWKSFRIAVLLFLCRLISPHCRDPHHELALPYLLEMPALATLLYPLEMLGLGVTFHLLMLSLYMEVHVLCLIQLGYVLLLRLLAVMSLCECHKCLSTRHPHVRSVLCTNLLLDKQGHRVCTCGGIHVKPSACCTTSKPIAGKVVAPKRVHASSVSDSRPCTWKSNKHLFLKAQEDLVPLVFEGLRKNSCMPEPLPPKKKVHCEQYSHLLL